MTFLTDTRKFEDVYTISHNVTILVLIEREQLGQKPGINEHLEIRGCFTSTRQGSRSNPISKLCKNKIFKS